MYYDENTPIREILASEKGRYVLAKQIPGFDAHPNLEQVMLESLGDQLLHPYIDVSAGQVAAILRELNTPAAEVVPGVAQRQSLDELEAGGYGAGPAPLAGPDSDFRPVTLEPCAGLLPAVPKEISLNGGWRLAAEADGAPDGRFVNDIEAVVPGSVHTALTAAALLPDTTFGRNQEQGREASYKAWWLKREFERPEGLVRPLLSFAGVCNRCDIWLNGELIATHEGMFGGPDVPVGPFLQARNVLVVKLHAVPFRPEADTRPNPCNNASWRDTVVFNNSYGWHYAKMPPLGIWAGVALREAEVAVLDPFIATRDCERGAMRLALSLRGGPGRLRGTVSPENFEGPTYRFTVDVAGDEAEVVKLSFAVPSPRLWWPVDMGAPSLYRLHLSYEANTGGSAAHALTFGIRTIEMAPLPEGPSPAKYNWTFVVNGKPMFIKGAGWCTADALMDFSPALYKRLIGMARAQHIQMLRAWGSGMPETDLFYDACDAAGILVMQEWPTAWDSHLTQPYHLMEETVRRNTLRLRNHASLAMWGAGNESPRPFGRVIDMMGRLATELDGTRPFHKCEPWGGARHDYQCWWGYRHLDYNLTMTADFFGEFGVASSPCYESVARYLPREELERWPPQRGGAFEYHLPIFGASDEINRLLQYAGYYETVKNCGMERFTVASQLAAAAGVRYTLERARTRWPDCTGALYYKLNDNFPAVSWACVDWYGAPKLSYYAIQDAFEPLRAIVLFDRLDLAGTPTTLPVWLADDAGALCGKAWTARVAVYGGDLQELAAFEKSGEGTVPIPQRLGGLRLDWAQADAAPLFTVAEVVVEGKLASRSFYIGNTERSKGGLHTLPKTTLALAVEGGKATVRNTGGLPAVGVLVQRKGQAHSFAAEDNFFWLPPGQAATLTVSDGRGLSVSAFNA